MRLSAILPSTASIDNHTLHFYLFTCGRNHKEFAAMIAMPGKAAKYPFSFSYELLDYTMDVGKGRRNTPITCLRPSRAQVAGPEGGRISTKSTATRSSARSR